MTDQHLPIISNYLSSDEIEQALKENNIQYQPIESEEKNRDPASIAIIAAIISGTLIGGPHWINLVLIPLVKSLRKRIKDKKQKEEPEAGKGLIKIEGEGFKIEIEEEMTDEQVESMFSQVKQIKGMPAIKIVNRQ
jgi:hypothetical protein